MCSSASVVVDAAVVDDPVDSVVAVQAVQVAAAVVA